MDKKKYIFVFEGSFIIEGEDKEEMIEKCLDEIWEVIKNKTDAELECVECCKY